MINLIKERYEIWVSKIETFIPKTEAKDVLDSVLLSMLERHKDITHFGCPDCYIINACKTAYFSKTSAYNRQYERHIPTTNIEDENIQDVIEDITPERSEGTEDEIPDVLSILEKAPFCWWEKELFKRKVLEGKTLKEMGEECNLTVGQVWYSYNKVRQWLKKNIDFNYGKK